MDGDRQIRRGRIVRRSFIEDNTALGGERRDVFGGMKGHAVERLRCVHCRNPIKPHQQVAGPESGDGTFHEDCWEQARKAGPASETQQRDYEQQIAENGLSALLSPYVYDMPRQRATNSSVWA